MQPRHILQLRSHAGFYGVEKVVVELAAGLQAAGSRVTVGIIEPPESADPAFRHQAERAGVACRIFPSSTPFDRGTIREVARFIREEEVDLVHAHGYKADVIAWLAGRITRRPVLSTCHPWLDTRRSWRAALYALIDKVVLLRLEQVVAISAAVARTCRLGPLHRREIPVIANGISLPDSARTAGGEELRRRLGVEPQGLLVGCVARLGPEKGHAVLLRAWAGVKAEYHGPLALALIGEGPERDLLERLCGELHLDDSVHFLGHREDVPQLLAGMDLFVLPSLSEGVPMALLEAMAAGVAVVTTTVGAMPEILDQGRAGLLVPPGVDGPLAAALLRLAGDADLRRKLAQLGRDRVAADYSREAMCRRYLVEYERLIPGRRRAA